MADKQTPNLTDKALAAKRERERREAEALRANLRRRKGPESLGEADKDNKEEDSHG